MTDAEVGQCILLLSESWMVGKECSLTDDPALLAQLAHTSQISPKVLNPISGNGNFVRIETAQSTSL